MLTWYRPIIMVGLKHLNRLGVTHLLLQVILPTSLQGDTNEPSVQLF